MAIEGGKKYTISDIETLPEGERAELIDGEMFMMAAPTLVHQDLLMWLSYTIKRYITEHKGRCRVLPAPFAVYIKKDQHNYVEPDISVICDPSRLDERGCNGAPDWIIEIISPSNPQHDYGIKLFKYRTAGVREYWIVNPLKHTVNVYDLEYEKNTNLYSFHDTIPVCIYDDFNINISDLLS